MLVISNHSPDYSLNCTPLNPITIATATNNNNSVVYNKVNKEVITVNLL